MKIKFNHSFGTMKCGWLQFSSTLAEVEQDEEPDAISSGWLRDCCTGIWYQSRSTRIECEKFTKIRSWPKGYSFEVVKGIDAPIQELERVYQAYLAHRKFTDSFSPLIDVSNSSFGIVKNAANQITAFTKFQHYNGGMESIMFCWDYSEPKTSLGLAIQAKEIEYASSLGLKHLYIGAGYETTCLYKAMFPGFQWWTGEEWSSNAEEYKKFCERDTRIYTIMPKDVLNELYQLEMPEDAGQAVCDNQGL